MVRGYRTGDGDDTGSAVDCRYPQIDGAAEHGIVQDGAALMDTRIHFRLVATQATAAKLAEPDIKLREWRSGSKSEELEWRGKYLRRSWVSQEEEQERSGEAKRWARED